MHRLATFFGAVPRMGLASTLIYIWKTKVFERLLAFMTAPVDGYRLGTLRTRQVQHPLLFRYGSSDVSVFSQIFVLDEYGPLPPLSDVRLIVDCGANVGYASAYFLSRYPAAQVIAVEPDARNYEVLTRNLSPYGARAKTMHSAIWTHRAGLAICRGGAATEWTTVVRETTDGEVPDVEATDITSLLRESGHTSIDILKVDIEGSEEVVFSRNYDSWLDTIRLLVIELHNNHCADIFYRALGTTAFTYSQSGELTIAHRTSRPS